MRAETPPVRGRPRREAPRSGANPDALPESEGLGNTGVAVSNGFPSGPTITSSLKSKSQLALTWAFGATGTGTASLVGRSLRKHFRDLQVRFGMALVELGCKKRSQLAFASRDVIHCSLGSGMFWSHAFRDFVDELHFNVVGKPKAFL